MKHTIKFLSILTSLIIMSISVSAETFNIHSSTTSTSAKLSSGCTNCTINIDKDAVLTVDQDLYFQNVSINGGSIVLNNKKMVFYSASTFDGVSMTLKNGANLVNSGALTIKNSAFTFTTGAWATVYTSISLTNSSWMFLDNSWMDATGGTFSLAGSSLSAGDGINTSTAYIKFNGATFSVTDATSFLSVGSSSNSYFNWGAYKTPTGMVKTTDNKMNCGTAKTNACSSPTVYGPSTLNVTGTSANATLPVVLSAFNVKYTNGRVVLAWTTEQEKNANRFEIERTNDGNNWTVIGQVTADGVSSVQQSYTYTDLHPLSGTVSYRLRIVDLDEAADFSPIKSVKISQASAVEMKIFPNPTSDRVQITTSNNEKMNVQLMSISGQVLKQVSGAGVQTISVSEFHAGNYLVRVADTTGNAQVFKLLVTK